MNASRHRPWVRTTLLVGVVYLLIGRAFAVPTGNVRGWRLAAWLLSAAVYAAHVGHEHYWLRQPPRGTATHVAAAGALGAFGLAVAGVIYTLSTTHTLQMSWLLALFVLPLAIAVPAFIVAFLAASFLARLAATGDNG